MFEFSPRGLDEELLPAEWSGAFADASSQSEFACSTFGASVFHGVGPRPVIEWTFTSTGGPREIWFQYAAADSRPMRLSANGQVVASHALWESTGGWNEVEQTSNFQVVAMLQPGDNVLRLEGDGATPHIRSVTTCFVAGDRHAVDDRYRKAKEFSAANDANHAGLVSGDFDDANRFITSLKRKGFTFATIASVFQAYVVANQRVQSEMHLLSGFGGVFNGERLRLRTVNDICDAVPFSAFVETGAFTGTTTEHFAKTGMPVLSCEAMLDTFLLASTRLSRYENVKLTLSDSRTFLRNVLLNERDILTCPLFYLDAHWNDDLPLPEELNIIMQGLEAYVVVVDDFQVPGSRYFYDRYENGNELTLNYLAPKLDLSTNPVFMTPSNASTEETGPRKGTLFVAPQKLYIDRLQYLTRLQRIDIMPFRR